MKKPQPLHTSFRKRISIRSDKRRKAMKVIIIGGGTTGVRAALTLRSMDADTDIMIIEKSPHLNIAACGIPEFLNDTIKDPEALLINTPEQLEQLFGIKVLTDVEVETVNPAQKMIYTADRFSYSYDKLLIATGSEQLRPDIAGVLSDQVFPVKDLKSAIRIKDYLQNFQTQNMVIIGASHLALEIADSFAESCGHVSLITENIPLLPMMQRENVKPLIKELAANRISLYTENLIRSFEETKIILDNGTEIPYDIALIARQNTPNLKLSILSKLDIGDTGGLIVNPFMQTSDKNIYAVGDNTELSDTVTGTKLRPTQPNIALEQARIAAANILDRKEKLEFYTPYLLCRAFNYEIGTFGANRLTLQASGMKFFEVSETGYSAELISDNREPLRLTLYFNAKGKILGAEGCGKLGIDKRLSIIAALMQTDANIYDLQNLILPYNYNFSTLNEILLKLGRKAVKLLEND